jgi:N-acetylmuramoyl-L-alanine amidase
MAEKPDTLVLTDKQVLAMTIYGEARNQGYLGMQAVASVVLNRVKHPRWWGRDIRSVCLDPEQFSCWNAGDPNRPIILRATIADGIYFQCLGIATQALKGQLIDNTNGADSYVVRGTKADWIENLTPVKSIGAHDFYITI